MKRMHELNEKVLVAKLERDKNIRENAEVEARNLREEVDRLWGSRRKRKEVRVKLKNRVGSKNGNGIEEVRLNNGRARSKERTGKQGEWTKVK